MGGRDRREQRRCRCGGRFSPLDAATTAREGAGDGFGHRLGYAVSDLDFTGVETAGIEGKSSVFRRGFPKSIDPVIGQIEGKFLVFSCWVLFLLFRIVDLSI
ncbi:hypothetical protein CRG98_030703 [Punica granatum]|uniref:Uncharacterized protein n=1 Tax=Punica granatum TaxID=22663 RepID=A0A2I0IY44_PUNGR|nr:hypothetical protein CRG98_030703 [Punica granatum]